MIAIRTAGVVVAAGLIVGCQQKREQPRVVAPGPAPVQAAESLRQSLVRANPDARVGIVAATVGRFAAVRDVPAGNVAEGATVQILDPDGEVVGYGLVRAVKNDTIHVLYQGDTRRGPEVGDLVMPASDAGGAAEEMPAGETMEPAAEVAEPSRLPPRRGNAAEEPVGEPADVAPAGAREAAPAEAAPAQPEHPAPSLKEEAQPGEFKPTQPADDKAALPPVEGATDAAEPAAPADAAAQPSPGDTNGTATGAEPAPAEPAPAEPAPAEPAPAEPAPAPQAGDAAPAPEAAKEDAAKDAGNGADEKAPEAEKPSQNK